MKIQSLEPLLRAHPFLQGMESRHIDLLVGCASEVRFEAGSMIFRLGEKADMFYILRQGLVALDVPAPQGAVTIETVSKGELLGWSWLFPPYRWNFDARALELVRAVALDGACVRKKCEEDSKLGYEVMKRFVNVVIDRLQATRMRLMDLYGGAK
jgi:CRP/FNR family cyclic AMP-dependent transcriptional regulator